MALKDLEKISKPARDSLRSYRGFNLFHGNDLDLFLILVRGEFNISGFHNANIRFHLPGKTSQQVCRLIKRLRKHGLIRKIRNTYKYYLTALGQRIILTALKLREMFIIPYLRGSLST
jgi:predicted transcriptional regulator